MSETQEEINKVEAGEDIGEIYMGDENEQLMGKIVQERYQLKHQSPTRKLCTRANLIITGLFSVIVLLGWVYLAQR